MPAYAQLGSLGVAGLLLLRRCGGFARGEQRREGRGGWRWQLGSTRAAEIEPRALIGWQAKKSLSLLSFEITFDRDLRLL